MSNRAILLAVMAAGPNSGELEIPGAAAGLMVGFSNIYISIFAPVRV